MNVEHRTSNIERRINGFYLFKIRFSEAIPSFDIRYSIFCDSLFYFREVSQRLKMHKPNPDKPEITNSKHHLMLKLGK